MKKYIEGLSVIGDENLLLVEVVVVKSRAAGLGSSCLRQTAGHMGTFHIY